MNRYDEIRIHPMTMNEHIERQNRAQGWPCYCQSLAFNNRCDFCTGLAARDGERAAEQMQRQKEATP